MNTNQHDHLHEHTHESHHRHEHEEFTPHSCDGEGHVHHHHEDGSCCCEHHAQEFHGLDRPLLICLILSAVCYLCGMLLPLGETWELVFMIASALLSGYDIILAAIKNLFKLRFFDEYFLMSFAAVAACVIGEYEEGAAVFLLYRIGEFCQGYAIRHSRRTIASVTGSNFCPPEDTHPKNRFITRFAQIYTPIILALAIIIAVVLPLVTDETMKEAVYRALTFLVLACPCAIVISVPLSYSAGIGMASRQGIFFRDSAAVDAVAKGEIKPGGKTIEINGKIATLCSPEENADLMTAELVLTGEGPGDRALRIARRTRLIAHENVWFTIAIKLTVLILAVCGISALWFAVFADSGVTILVVLNSLRAFAGKK